MRVVIMSLEDKVEWHEVYNSPDFSSIKLDIFGLGKVPSVVLLIKTLGDKSQISAARPTDFAIDYQYEPIRLTKD